MASGAIARPPFADLLNRALTEPGAISRAYTAFHEYSVGNQLLAWSQCAARGIEPGPISTFNGWMEKGRFVRKGEKAITLCRPVVAKRTTTAEDGTERTTTATCFAYKPFWFALSQTDGAAVDPEPIPAWEKRRALSALDVTEEAFACTDGNVQGYARRRTIAVSPLAELPYKTRFHELAHVVLGHTAEADAGLTDSELTPHSLSEVEAEAVALVCLEALGLPGAEYCRGYIQHWNSRRGGEPIPERSAQRILRAADAILKAGTESQS